MEYDRTGQAGQKQSRICIEALFGAGQWRAITEIQLPDLTAMEDELNHSVKLSLACSGTLCAVAFVSSSEQHAFQFDLRVWQLPGTSQGSATELFRNSYAVNGGVSVWDAPPIAWEPVIMGQFVLCGGSVLAFDGTRIYENTKLDTSYFSFADGCCAQAMGQRDFIQSRVQDGEQKSVLVQALRYDPAHPENFPGQEPVFIQQEWPEELREDDYVPSICGNVAVFEQQIYDLQKDQPFDYPIGQLITEASASVVNGGNFIAFPSVFGGASAVRIVNGMVQQQEPLEGDLPQVQIEGQIFYTESDQFLFLYMNTGDSFHQAISNYQIYRILTNDGIGVTGECYVYDEASAVCDSSGRYVKYYTVDVYQQAEKTNGFTRYQYINSIAGTQPYENMTAPYAMDGQLRATSVYDDAGTPLSHTTFSYDMTRSIAEVPEGERTKAIYGAVLRASTSRLEQNGVITETMVEHDPFTGETAAVTNLVHNVFGDEIRTVERSYAAAMVEPVFIWQNRLTENVKTLTEWKKNQEEVQVAEAKAVGFQTYTGKKRCVLAGGETLQWTGNGNPYETHRQRGADWEDTWERVETISAYDVFGNVIGQEAPVGICETAHYSKDGFFCVGHVTSSLDRTSMICTFEDYEPIPEVWGPFVTEEASIAGRRSLKLSPGQEPEALTVSLTAQEYGIAFWVTEQITLTAEGESVFVLETLSQKKGAGTYQIMRFTVQEDSEVRIRFENSSSGNVYLDLFSLFPFSHPPLIQVYRDHLLDATVNGYGCLARYIYDRRNNQFGMQSDISGASWTIPFYYRLSQFGQGAHGLNAELMVSCNGESVYRPMVNTGEEIALPGGAETTMDCAVYVDVRGDADAKLQLGVVSVCFSGGEWILSDGEETRRVAGAGGDGEWLLLAGKRILFFFNGEYVCGLEHPCSQAAETLCLSGQAVFSKLLWGRQVTFGIRYLDAMGRVRQGQMFNGKTVTVTQNFYDSENRLIAQTKPAEFDDIAFGYLENFARLDLETGIMSGRIAEQYPEDEGFPYVSQRYEATPEGRMLESGLPGKAYAIDPSVEEQSRQTSRLSYEKVDIPGLKLSESC